MAGVTGLRYNFGRTTNEIVISESPLFERQNNIQKDDYVELQQLRIIIDNLQSRIVKLEKINVDLEGRLEEQAKQSMIIEKECLLIEQKWILKNDEKTKEIEYYKNLFQQEKLKGDRLREHLHRTERELYSILQRKYELMKGGSGPNTNNINNQMKTNKKNLSNEDELYATNNNNMINNSLKSSSNNIDNNSDSSMFFQNNSTIKKESKKARERTVLANLSDFLGFY